MCLLIKSEKQYNEYLARISDLMDKPEDSLTPEESDELELKAILVEAYEKENWPVDYEDPILPYWVDELMYELESTELDDTESATTEYMQGYYAGCRDTKIALGGRIRYFKELNGRSS